MKRILASIAMTAFICSPFYAYSAQQITSFYDSEKRICYITDSLLSEHGHILRQGDSPEASTHNRLALQTALNNGKTILGLSRDGVTSLSAKISALSMACPKHYRQLEYHVSIPEGIWFLSHPDTLRQPNLSTNQMAPLLDLSDFTFSDDKELVLRGASATRTTLKPHLENIFIFANHFSNITLRDMTIEQNVFSKTTQGEVLQTSSNLLTVKIDPGFPSPLQTGKSPQRQTSYLRKFFRDNPADPNPHFSQQSPNAYPYQPISSRRSGADIENNIYLIQLPSGANDIAPGDLVALKTPIGSSEMMRFENGEKITITNTIWRKEARFVSKNVDYVNYQGNRVEPPAPINGIHFALSTANGGPQINYPSWWISAPNHPDRNAGGGHSLSGNHFINVGGIPIAIYNNAPKTKRGIAIPTLVSGNHFISPFYQGLLIFDVKGNHFYDYMKRPSQVPANIFSEYESVNVRLPGEAEANHFIHTGLFFACDHAALVPKPPFHNCSGNR